MVVLPAASRPTIKIRISFLPNCITRGKERAQVSRPCVRTGHVAFYTIPKIVFPIVVFFLSKTCAFNAFTYHTLPYSGESETHNSNTANNNEWNTAVFLNDERLRCAVAWMALLPLSIFQILSSRKRPLQIYRWWTIRGALLGHFFRFFPSFRCADQFDLMTKKTGTAGADAVWRAPHAAAQQQAWRGNEDSRFWH